MLCKTVLRKTRGGDIFPTVFMRGGHLAEIEAAQRITFVARYAGRQASKVRQAGPGN